MYEINIVWFVIYWSLLLDRICIHLINSPNTIRKFCYIFQCQNGQRRLFKLIDGNESLHEISNDNGVSVVNFATSRNLIVRSTMFPQLD
jgi:hypothetical protein